MAPETREPAPGNILTPTFQFLGPEPRAQNPNNREADSSWRGLREDMRVVVALRALDPSASVTIALKEGTWG